RGGPRIGTAHQRVLGGEHRSSGAIRTGTPAGDCCTCAVVGGARRKGCRTKRGCWPRIWRIIQALRVGVGDDVAFWSRYCRSCCPRLNSLFTVVPELALYPATSQSTLKTQEIVKSKSTENIVASAAAAAEPKPHERAKLVPC